MDFLLTALRAVAEPTRLRLLALCAEGELSVSELAQILGQSQPRVSRHLKLLTDAGLLERVPEGSWVFHRLVAEGPGLPIAQQLIGLLPEAAKNLLRIAALRRDAAALGIEKIDASDAGGYIDIGSQTSVDPVTLVQMVQNESQIYRLQGAHRLQFRMDLSDAATRFSQVEKLLDRLATGGVENKAVG